MNRSKSRSRLYSTALATFVSIAGLMPGAANSQDGSILQRIILGDISVANVRKALLDAIEAIEQATRTADGEARKTGDSAEQNIRRIIKDIDERFGTRADILIRRLDDSERKYMQDVGKTIVLSNEAAKSLLADGGSQARATLFEADILSYNTSYSLPCRSKTPRIVYVKNTPVVIGDQIPAVIVRGNFLDQGKLTDVKINNTPAKVIARSANEVTLEIPDAVSQSVDSPRLYQVSLSTQEKTFFPVICIPRIADMRSPLQVAVELSPQRTVSVHATIGGNYIIRKPPQTTVESSEFRKERVELIDSNCAINEIRTKDYSIPSGWAVSHAKYDIESANGGSYIEGESIYPDRVVVRARLIGKGYRVINDPIFGYELYRNCNGRGWVVFTPTLFATRTTTQTFEPQTVLIANESQNVSGAAGQNTFTVRYSMAGMALPEAVWSYTVTINRKVGLKALPPLVLSEQIQNDLGTNTATTMNDGVLSVKIGS